jgi:serine/threonine protein kinase
VESSGLADDAENQAQARVGCVLDDKWTLERLLGLGGMAAVYSARHRNGARAAVKVLHSDLSRHKDVRERFLREGYAANRVEHAGAVKVLDDDVIASGPEAGTAYLVMELLEGESLQDRLERGPPVGELEFLTIAASVLEVLEAAHSRGVVHRDLKPENLFLAQSDPPGGDPRVKVLDFGLARLVQGQAITSYGLALGTPSFMSPEQAAGRIDEIDGRTDLFALAATGFRICVGRRIHEAANPVELVRKMANVAAPRVRDVRPEVSAPCARVIDRALEFRRDDRYETASAMREDVKRAIAEIQGTGPTQLALEPPPSMSPAPAPSGEQTTLELSESDLDAPFAPALGGMPAPERTEESIHIPRRRSIVPWLMGIAALVIGGKLWFAHHAASRAGDASNLPASTSASAAGDLAAPDASAPASAQVPVFTRDRDAGPDVPGPAKPASSALAGALPKPADAGPASTHHASKVGPGNLHKLPRKHHSKTHPAKGAT